MTNLDDRKGLSSDSSAARPDAPEFGAEEEIGPLWSE